MNVLVTDYLENPKREAKIKVPNMNHTGTKAAIENKFNINL